MARACCWTLRPKADPSETAIEFMQDESAIVIL